MVHLKAALLLFTAPIASCAAAEAPVNPAGMTVEERFAPPAGFARVPAGKGSFAEYLRKLPLRAYGEKVHYYDGSIKNKDVYVSVVDMEIGTRDLLQCADAVMKLRAEYLYAKKDYDSIGFHISNGDLMEYRRWTEGYRPKVKGSSVTWSRTDRTGFGRAVFEEFLTFIYGWAGTLTLSAELVKKDLRDMAIGNVFIKGGSPGHVVMIVDLAESPKTGEKAFLLAQSYMPAQEIQILKSGFPMSPWYRIAAGEPLLTPEWRFEPGSLKGF